MIIRSPRELTAGLFLLVIGAGGLWKASELTTGTLGQMGPGLLPQALAFATMVCGILVAAGSLRGDGAVLDRWHLRGPLFILGAAIAFGMTVRPLGLAVAGPIALVICAGASPESRASEVAVFGGALVLFCVGLFKVALGLPIPVLPWLIGY